MVSTFLAGLLVRPWARRVSGVAITALTVALFLFNLRRSGERMGRAAERFDTLEAVTHAQRQMLQEASRRPRNRDDLVDRLRDGEF
jgi:type II secretory pathway component PulJ